MLRLRSAYLALASGFLLTLSGCCSFCEEGRLFPRLSNGNSSFFHRGVQADCECHSAMMPPITEGPVLMPGAFPPPPIVNVPPQAFKIPQAPPTPYIPGN